MWLGQTVKQRMSWTERETRSLSLQWSRIVNNSTYCAAYVSTQPLSVIISMLTTHKQNVEYFIFQIEVQEKIFRKNVLGKWRQEKKLGKKVFRKNSHYEKKLGKKVLRKNCHYKKNQENCLGNHQLKKKIFFQIIFFVHLVFFY